MERSLCAAGDLFVPLMFLAFNAGDVLGRLGAGLEPWRSRAPAMSFLVSYQALRGVLLVGLVLCHVVTPSPWQLPHLLRCAGTSAPYLSALQVPSNASWK